jgi:hypothetical protein
MRVGAATLYIAVMLGVVALFNADIGEAFVIWSAASFCLGWITRSPWSALLPFLASPIAVPFGYQQVWMGSDPSLLWVGLLLLAPVQGAIVILAFGGRRLYKRCRVSRNKSSRT